MSEGVLAQLGCVSGGTGVWAGPGWRTYQQLGPRTVPSWLPWPGTGRSPPNQDETLSSLNSSSGLSQDSSRGHLLGQRSFQSCFCTGHGMASRNHKQGAGWGVERTERSHQPVGLPSASLWALLGQGWEARRLGRPVTTFPITPGLQSPAVPTFQDRAFRDRQKWLQGCWGPGSPAPPTPPRCPAQPGSQHQAEGHLSGNP